jgi:hypothetical protein
MSASARGTPEGPGRHVTARSGLNRAILDQGCGGCSGRCPNGLVKAPLRHTGQACPACGHVEDGNRISRAGFRCLESGYEGYVDHVGALSALAAGRAAITSAMVTGHGAGAPRAGPGSPAPRERGRRDLRQRGRLALPVPVATPPQKPLRRPRAAGGGADAAGIPGWIPPVGDPRCAVPRWHATVSRRASGTEFPTMPRATRARQGSGTRQQSRASGRRPGSAVPSRKNGQAGRIGSPLPQGVRALRKSNA